MSESETDNDGQFKSTAEEEDDASHETTDDANQLPNYLTDPPAKRDAFNDLYVEEELAKVQDAILIQKAKMQLILIRHSL
eukprot:9396437-Ditylum_brightwellii.AAC.1